MQDQITKITLDCMMGIREGVGKCRINEFSAYIDDLIQAKQAGISPDAVQWPMLSDRVRQGVEASLASRTQGGVEGGVSYQIVNLSGNITKTQDQGIRVKVDMEFASTGAPDFEAIKAMSIEELTKLKTLTNG